MARASYSCLEALPADVKMMVLTRLAPSALVALGSTCRSFRRISCAGALWRPLIKQHWGRAYSDGPAPHLRGWKQVFRQCWLESCYTELWELDKRRVEAARTADRVRTLALNLEHRAHVLSTHERGAHSAASDLLATRARLAAAERELALAKSRLHSVNARIGAVRARIGLLRDSGDAARARHQPAHWARPPSAAGQPGHVRRPGIVQPPASSARPWSTSMLQPTVRHAPYYVRTADGLLMAAASQQLSHGARRRRLTR